MRASEIQPEDKLYDQLGNLVYTVAEVTSAGSAIHARVRYEIDGGDGLRTWWYFDEVPLVRV